jgi:hypothetical protein
VIEHLTGSFMLSIQRRRQISELAEFIADDYCLNQKIVPEMIAEDNEISYCYGNYADAFDGLLEHWGGDFHIYLNLDRLQEVNNPRTRFTFAHELGHYFLDEHRIALQSGKSPAHPSFCDFASKNPVEQEADCFAASLLNFELELLLDLACQYQTSRTATLLRYLDLGDIPLMVVASSYNRVLWYRCSADFPFQYLHRFNLQLPMRSVAGEYFRDNRQYAQPEIVFAEDWFIDLAELDYRKSFYEQCIYSPDRNFVLSVIWQTT